MNMNLSPTQIQLLLGRRASQIVAQQHLAPNQLPKSSRMIGIEFWTDEPTAAMSWAETSDDVALIGLYRTNYRPAGYRCFAMICEKQKVSIARLTVMIGSNRHELIQDENESKQMGLPLMAEPMPGADRFATSKEFAGTLMTATRCKSAHALIPTKAILSPPSKLFIGANWIMGSTSRKLGCCLTAEVPTPTLRHASSW